MWLLLSMTARRCVGSTYFTFSSTSSHARSRPIPVLFTNYFARRGSVTRHRGYRTCHGVVWPSFFRLRPEPSPVNTSGRWDWDWTYALYFVGVFLLLGYILYRYWSRSRRQADPVAPEAEPQLLVVRAEPVPPRNFHELLPAQRRVGPWLVLAPSDQTAATSSSSSSDSATSSSSSTDSVSSMASSNVSGIFPAPDSPSHLEPERSRGIAAYRDLVHNWRALSVFMRRETARRLLQLSGGSVETTLLDRRGRFRVPLVTVRNQCNEERQRRAIQGYTYLLVEWPAFTAGEQEGMIRQLLGGARSDHSWSDGHASTSRHMLPTPEEQRLLDEAEEGRRQWEATEARRLERIGNMVQLYGQDGVGTTDEYSVIGHAVDNTPVVVQCSPLRPIGQRAEGSGSGRRAERRDGEEADENAAPVVGKGKERAM
ncbi:hypothetical protein FB45DRAFT_871900 [Roridomyces roridus]|uniref:Uncharacterized protein n=1 Tax=Roridomyces roridus TaxID=1738132 RepID=A0AAD7BDV9_9AGAR|nr:hypothetical protein FB45DRAFT_871900 [Roridomyces roridus]